MKDIRNGMEWKNYDQDSRQRYKWGETHPNYDLHTALSV